MVKDLKRNLHISRLPKTIQIDVPLKNTKIKNDFFHPLFTKKNCHYNSFYNLYIFLKKFSLTFHYRQQAPPVY